MEPTPSDPPPPPPSGGSSLPPPSGGSSPPPAEPAPASVRPPGLLGRFLETRASAAFLVAVVVVYLLCLQASAWNMRWIDPAVVTKYGGYEWGQVRDEGQWWRFLTTLFVSRASLSALIFVFVFFQLGPQIERALGSARFLLLYLGAGAGGVALAEVVDPGFRLVGTITGVYVLLGATPGLVFGSTGSLAKTVQDPGVQSSAFWIGLSFVLVWFLFPGGVFDAASALSAAGLGLVLAGALAWSRRQPGPGWIATALALLVVAGTIALATTGRAWRDGRLTDRGRPATGRLSGGDSGGSVLADPDEAVGELRAEARAFLEPYGPLPRAITPRATGMEPTLSEEAREEADVLLRELTAVARSGNKVLGELDGERIRLMLLLGEASRKRTLQDLADEYLVLAPQEASAEARALSGVVYLQTGEPEIARDRLTGALDEEGMRRQLPEALYYLGEIGLRRRDEAEASAYFAEFLDVVGEDPERQPVWRQDLVRQALVQLDRR